MGCHTSLPEGHKSAVDHVKLLDAAKGNIFLVEKYLLALDIEAQEHSIEKAEV